jgi:hypothetical protein
MIAMKPTMLRREARTARAPDGEVGRMRAFMATAAKGED